MANISISIVTPTLNRENFIEGCIKNVVEQDFESVEHIFIDGKSTDGTVLLLEKYAQTYNHIRWISESDTGQSDAINKGIKLARGSIIGILNVDDYYEPNVLKNVDFRFKELPEPTLLVGNCNVWNHNLQLISVNRPNKLNLDDLLLGFHVNPFPINPSAYFYHTSLHDIIGLYDLNEHYVLDVDFLFRAVQTANVQYIDQILGNYCMLEGTKTVESIRSGQSPLRVERIIRKYRSQLPFLRQLQLAFMYNVFKTIRYNRRLIDRSIFYFKNTHELKAKLKSKFNS